MMARFAPSKDAISHPMPRKADLPNGAKYKDNGTQTKMIASATKDALVRTVTRGLLHHIRRLKAL
jgi:hypothetical protein